MLTTYQAKLIIKGKLKSNWQIISALLRPDAPTEDVQGYPIETFWQTYEKHRAGHGSLNTETGDYEIKVEPAGLMDFWQLSQNIEVYTTNH